MTSDFLSYSLGATSAPRLRVFQDMPVDLELPRKGSKSTYGDFFSEISDDTDVSEGHIKSRRYSLVSQGSFGETFTSESAPLEDAEEDFSPARRTYYSHFVTELTQ